MKKVIILSIFVFGFSDSSFAQFIYDNDTSYFLKPSFASDSCKNSYTIQIEKLVNEYFKRNVIQELITKRKQIYNLITLKVLPNNAFTVDIKLGRYDSALFTKNELNGLNEYIKVNGKFQYCLLKNEYSGMIEDEKENYIYLPTEKLKQKTKQLNGKPISWHITIPNTYLKYNPYYQKQLIFGNNNEQIPPPTFNCDPYGNLYRLQIETLVNEYFKRDFINELIKEKKRVCVSVTITIQDTFSVEIWLPKRDGAFITKDELSELTKYIKQKGKFQYCFLLEGCGGVFEAGEEKPPKPTEEEIQYRNKIHYGELNRWTFCIPSKESKMK